MMSWSRYIVVICVTLLVGCASTGKHLKYSYVFMDELSDLRESVARGSTIQAIQSLDMLLTMDSNNIDARFLRAVAYQKLEQYEKAVDAYNALLKISPESGRAHYNLAMIYAFKMVDRKAALEHFDRFLDIDIKNPKTFDVAKIMCALAYEDSTIASWSVKEGLGQDTLEARKNMLTGALKLNPTLGDAHYELAQLLLGENKKDEAIIHLAKASLFKPNDPKFR